MIIFYIVLAFLLLATFLPTIPSHKSFVRYFDFPRIQILFLILSLNTIYYFYGDNYIFALLSLPACIKIITEIIPYCRFAKKHLKTCTTPSSLKLYTANVLQENNHAEKLIEQVQRLKPDMVFLVETNHKWQNLVKDIAKQYPFKVEIPLEKHNGMLLYSRFKLENVQIRYLVLDFIPSITADVVLADGKIVKFYGVHPRPPRPQNKVENRDKELIIIAEEIHNLKTPAIISGDLNDVGWSPTTKRFLHESKMLDPRKGRGLFNTYNAKIWPFRWPLDHIFTTKHFKVREIAREKFFGSDHFPIYIDLCL